MVRFENEDAVIAGTLVPNSLGRIHSHTNGMYTVWVLDERTFRTIIIEVPLHLMGQYFRQEPHNIFPHFARPMG